MKIKVLGSGGCVALPLPTCQCEVCNEARNKGVPFSRSGCSIFIEDIKTIIDTPEDSVYQINRENISEVKNILYSHWDPDHTLGMRVIEHLKLRWLEFLVDNKSADNKISLYGLYDVIEDLKQIRNKYGSYLGYYKSTGLIEIKSLNEHESITIDNIKISFIPVKTPDTSTIFVFEEEERKLIYAPCDIKPFPKDEETFYNAECMILGNVIPDEPLKGGYFIPKDNILKQTLFTMEEVIEIKNKYNIKEVIITHIEEDWGKSYSDYIKLEEKYREQNIKFAYDGMEINL
ncbi:beta-lactamase superfamily domain protein [Clostridium argentinense CDC 2741]|uniref:Beta-lactamase superfamily domain protein n=1 Tax=Clostridium argentinense CDC 2741 TaxID=1418104 RepID=A0A0C1R2I7_9CLOT|nr:MBL fold metallo-hydrolase [Clostridium argentinense]ARC84215.1 MBL fold metallo-hydrolase [Clostridium argentinense]KIE44666.1 beta-lactamase superfamily domain protein [Clostridium argentinense CDC 2741]NFF38168.1 MBL fold metallo-hydrolase [Clostridium argentinense]NFP49246.1 MBL fold metallo-hydrolase [Clostridium argentinense]NFP71474.1 MBL fold metallo-hydrolase [Clostridium argentinense]